MKFFVKQNSNHAQREFLGRIMVHPANEYLQYFSRQAAKKEKDENSGSEQGAGKRSLKCEERRVKSSPF